MLYNLNRKRMLGHAAVPAAPGRRRAQWTPNPPRFLQSFPAATRDQVGSRVFPRALIIAFVAFVNGAIIGSLHYRDDASQANGRPR
jgi:hypothetical protein